MEEEQIIEKIQTFLEEKEGLDVQSAYFLVKKLYEDYWDKVQEEGDLTDSEPEDGLETEEEPGEEVEEEPEEEVEEEKEKDHRKGIKKAVKGIKKPKVQVKEGKKKKVVDVESEEEL